MKGLKFKMLICLTMLISASLFSQSSQVKPIQLDNEDGVFITIETMDSISLKLIDRTVLQKENLTLSQIVQNFKLQNEELNFKVDLSLNQINNYKDLWRKTETQKDKLFASLESQKQITKNVKKKRLKTGFYISEEVFRSVSLDLLC